MRVRNQAGASGDEILPRSSAAGDTGAKSGLEPRVGLPSGDPILRATAGDGSGGRYSCDKNKE